MSSLDMLLTLVVLASTGCCSVQEHPTIPTFDVFHPADAKIQKSRGAGDYNLTMSGDSAQ